MAILRCYSVNFAALTELVIDSHEPWFTLNQLFVESIKIGTLSCLLRNSALAASTCFY